MEKGEDLGTPRTIPQLRDLQARGRKDKNVRVTTLCVYTPSLKEGFSGFDHPRVGGALAPSEGKRGPGLTLEKATLSRGEQD